MAAAPDTTPAKLVDLRHLSQQDLDSLLVEETRIWQRDLHWDYRASAELVQRFVRMNTLQGQALMLGSEAAGYVYHVHEDRKGLIGGLFVKERFAAAGYEQTLLASAVEALFRMPLLRRIESQLMMMRHAGQILLPRPDQARKFARRFLSLDLTQGGWAVGEVPGIRFEPWSELRFDEAAGFIAACYEGHVDGILNDQYRTRQGSRRFLLNITQYPGCGVFQPETSGFAMDGDRMVGLVLTSTVGPEVGHITQICVLPGLRGRGLGTALVQRTAHAMHLDGRTEVTLTVTAENRGASQLYDRLGFKELKQFHALLWDRR